jgi:hypothetical protein
VPNPAPQAILAGNTPAAIFLARHPDTDHAAIDGRGRSMLIVAALALSHHEVEAALLRALLAPGRMLDHRDASGEW